MDAAAGHQASDRQTDRQTLKAGGVGGKEGQSQCQMGRGRNILMRKLDLGKISSAVCHSFVLGEYEHVSGGFNFFVIYYFK